MLVRLIAAVACLFVLSAFTDDEKKKLITDCAGSLAKAKEQGRGIPDAAVQNRVKICTCIGDGLAKDTTVSPGEKVGTGRLAASSAACSCSSSSMMFMASAL